MLKEKATKNKKQGTDDFILLGKALSYVDNFLGTVVEQPRCR